MDEGGDFKGRAIEGRLEGVKSNRRMRRKRRRRRKEKENGTDGGEGRQRKIWRRKE